VTALSFDDEQIRGMTQKCFDEHHYILDPHTAIAYLALESFDLKNSQGLFVATAHPAKFIDTFDKALQKHIQLPAPLKNLLSLQLEPVYIKNDYSSLQKLL
jgi:threonine synthase